MVKASIGGKPPSLLGMNALLDFSMDVTLGGERLSADEIKAMMQGVDGLQLIRGHWVEIDRKKLGHLLERFQALEDAAAGSGVPFAEAMRLMAGASLDDAKTDDAADWSQQMCIRDRLHILFGLANLVIAKRKLLALHAQAAS